MQIIKQVILKNSSGLHIRPATTIVRLLRNKRSRVFFMHKKMRVDAKSIMGLLTLLAKKNAKITIFVEGSDAKQVMDELVEAFDKCFEGI